jgi:hypothetical protein
MAMVGNDAGKAIADALLAATKPADGSQSETERMWSVAMVALFDYMKANLDVIPGTLITPAGQTVVLTPSPVTSTSIGLTGLGKVM